MGELVSSEKISEIIDKCQNLGDSELSFIIGGSNGVTEEFKQKCKYVISFGKITFPHHFDNGIFDVGFSFFAPKP